MNKYSDKSNFEINKAVAVQLDNDGKITSWAAVNGIMVGIAGEEYAKKFDPCNNPADAMPIFIENKMGAMFLGDLVQIINFSGTIANFGNNFYRTIAELFLMMKDAENENEY